MFIDIKEKGDALLDQNYIIARKSPGNSLETICSQFALFGISQLYALQLVHHNFENPRSTNTKLMMIVIFLKPKMSKMKEIGDYC